MRTGFLLLLRHDRAVVLTGLVAATVLAWVYLLLGAGIDIGAAPPGAAAMPGMAGETGGGMAMPAGMAMAAPGWSPGYGALVFVMWAVMMMAMMLPSAAPTILLVARLAGRHPDAGGPGAAGGLAASAAGLFAAGYAVVWLAFSLAATVVDWKLSQAGLLSPMMAATDRLLAAGVLIAAGIYQWTPLKEVCLRRCRSPLGVLLNHWRPGRLGPLSSGIINGVYCLGCCWMLMALLFVGGVMNLAWIAGIALLVLVEKTLPLGEWSARLAGAALLLWGGVTLWQAV